MDRKKSVEDQKRIGSFFERVVQSHNIREHELGSGDGYWEDTHFRRHDGYTYSMDIGKGERLVFRVSVEKK